MTINERINIANDNAYKCITYQYWICETCNRRKKFWMFRRHDEISNLFETFLNLEARLFRSFDCLVAT